MPPTNNGKSIEIVAEWIRISELVTDIYKLAGICGTDRKAFVDKVRKVISLSDEAALGKVRKFVKHLREDKTGLYS